MPDLETPLAPYIEQVVSAKFCIAKSDQLTAVVRNPDAMIDEQPKTYQYDITTT